MALKGQGEGRLRSRLVTFENSGGGEGEHWVCSLGYTPIFTGVGFI